jgi:transposase
MIKYISIRSDGQMANKYNAEERSEALKLADEIGAAAAARRLGMNADTIYG